MYQKMNLHVPMGMEEFLFLTTIKQTDNSSDGIGVEHRHEITHMYLRISEKNYKQVKYLTDNFMRYHKLRKLILTH